MQNNNLPIQQSNEHGVSSGRTQRILEHLEKQLRRPHEPSHDDFRRIIEFIHDIPEAYKTIGLTAIAEHFVNGMELHLLTLMTRFEEKAEQEGISLKERQATLDDVLPETFQTIKALNKQLSVKSLDELVALNNITIALYTLSSVETAEEAQRWLYELPTTYSRKLRQNGLLPDEQHNKPESKSQQSASNAQFVNWQSSYMPSKSQDVQGISNSNIGIVVSTPNTLSSKPVSVPIETSNPNIVSAA